MNLLEIDEKKYEDLKNNISFWDKKIANILRNNGTSYEYISKFKEGYNIVYDVDNKYVLKLFPHFVTETDDYGIEYAVLKSFEKYSFSFDVPKIINVGEYEGWKYIIMTKLEGKILTEVYHLMTDEEKVQLAVDLGNMIKEMHTVDVTDIDYNFNSWINFINTQKKGLVTHHTNNGLDDKLIKDLDDYVSKTNIKNENICLLTGEYTPFNLMIQKQNNKWVLSGMFDYADCFIGEGDFDLPGPLLFIFKQDENLVRIFLESYGISAKEQDNELRNKLTTYTLLHMYSNIPFFVSLSEFRGEINNLKHLEQIWYKIGD